MRWFFGVLLGVITAGSAGSAGLPDQSPDWSIRIDWPRQALMDIAQPPDPDSLQAPSITMLRNDYAGRGGFPLGGVSLTATFQLEREHGHVSIGVIDLPARFEDEGHVISLGRPVVTPDVPDSRRRTVQILENYAYYQDARGKNLCRSFLNGQIDTLDIRGRMVGYSGDRSHALSVLAGGGPATGLTYFYYDITDPPRPRLLWTHNLPGALPALEWTSLSADGELAAIQYLDGILKLIVLDAKGQVRLQHTHGPDERPAFGLEFVSPNELLEGFDPEASFQETEGLSLYRIRS